jgi:hypothetical protein
VLAAKRREEELAKIEEERLALEARREEMKRKALEKQMEQKKKETEKEKLLHSMEEDLKPTQSRTDMNKILHGMDEIAAGNEQAQPQRISYTQTSAKNDMNDELSTIEKAVLTDYKYGFVTDIEVDEAPPGLNEDIIRFISAKKSEPEWMLEWRLKAYRHWTTLAAEEPKWANIKYPPINFQEIIYYSAPKQKINPKNLDEIDPELRRTFEKLGISLNEQKRLSGVAVDAVIDSVSIGTSFKKQLGELGIIFCSMTDAIQEHDLFTS